MNRIGGGEIEAAVLIHLRKLLGTPPIVNQLALKLKRPGKEVNELLSRQTELWNEMFPAERNRLMHLLLKKVTLYENHLDLELRTEGMQQLLEEVICVPQTEQESTFVSNNAIHPWNFRSAFKFFEVNSVDCGLFIRWIVEISFGDLKLRTLPTSSKSQCKSAGIQSEF